MKTRVLTYTIAMAVIAAVTIPATLAAQDTSANSAKPPLYVVKDLGTLGGTSSVAEGISDRGWIAGSANLAGDQSGHAFLWRDGVMTDLGTLGGPNSSEQWPVKDNRGLIAAVGETSNVDPLGENFCGFNTGLTCLGFLWQDGQTTPLPTLGGNNGEALGANNRGEAVGYAENNIQDPNCVPPQVLDFGAVIWGPKAGDIRQLPPLPGDTTTAASGINDREQVVGVSGSCSAPISRGVLWENGTVTDLGNLGGVLNTQPWTINPQGVVVGQSDLAGDTTNHAFLWSKDGGMQDLGTLPGDSASLAFGINANGQVVGGSCIDVTYSSCRAFLWQDGLMIDLNTLVKPGSTPLYLFFGNDINSRGELALFAVNQNTGEYHAAIGIPCDANHVGVAGCEELATDAGVVPVTSERPRIVLPENIRERLQKRLGFASFARGVTADNAQPVTGNFLREDLGINFGGPKDTNSCIPIGSYGCKEGTPCCAPGYCSGGHCCRIGYGASCNKTSDCCWGICIRHSCR